MHRGIRLPMGEGSTAQRMTEMLRIRKYMVVNFIFPNGYWRSPQADVMRWEAICNSPSGTVMIGSWDSMTSCIRNGFTIEEKVSKGMSGGIEVHANEKPHRKKNSGAQEVTNG